MIQEIFANHTNYQPTINGTSLSGDVDIAARTVDVQPDVYASVSRLYPECSLNKPSVPV